MAWLGCPLFKAVDPVTGAPIPGACLFTMSPGGSWPSSAKTAYYDLAMTQAAPNPIVANGNGDFLGAGAGVFLSGAYQLVLTSADGTIAAYGSRVFWTLPNYQGNGPAGQFTSVSSYASLSAAILAIGSTPTTLLITSPQTLTATVTIPSTLSLLFAQGGSINLNGFNITINSPFQSPGPIDLFTGTGTVIFGAGTLPTTADPAWFGGGSSGASAANTASVNVIATLPASNATPDVSALAGINGTFKTNNSNATVITNFSNMVAGQKFSLLVNDANTTFGPNIRGVTGVVSQYTVLDFISDGTYAYCVGMPPNVPIQSYRNRLINGEIRIDQRNAGAPQTIAANAAAANAYCVDRWCMIPQGANITGQQVSGPAGTPWQNMYQINGAPGITSVSFFQRIESVNIEDLANSNSSVSFSTEISTTGSNANIAWNAVVPTALDNYGSTANFANGVWTVNSNLTRYAANFALNANAANGLQVGVTISNLTSGIFLVTGLQIEQGTVATPFERRPYDVELNRCLRYLPCIRWGAISGSPIIASGVIAANGANGSGYATIQFPVPARVAPSNYNAYDYANHTFPLQWESANTNTTWVVSGSPWLQEALPQSALIGIFSANMGAVGTFLWLAANIANACIIFTGCEL